MDARALVRWGTRHGAGAVVGRLGVRSGDHFARLSADPELRADPYAFYDQIRAAAPLVPGRFALATARYEVVADLLRAPGFHSGFPEETLPRPAQSLLAWARDPAVLGPLDRPSMVVSNGPDHARYRRLVNRSFTPRALEVLAGSLEKIAVELLDDLAARSLADGSVDVIDHYARLLPVLALAEVLGVPVSMRETFARWGRELAVGVDFPLRLRDFRRYEVTLAELNRWLRAHMAQLRRCPGADVLSGLVAAAADDRATGGSGLDETELSSIAILLMAAGFETTVHLIGNGCSHLLDHPDQLAALRADPARWPNAVEETLRFDAPLQNTIRYAAHATTVHGVRVPKGKLVVLLLGGANRDPATFTEPHIFDTTRGNARDHLGFSVATHFCVGAALARMEAQIGLRMLFERFPGIRRGGAPQRAPTRNVRGFNSIPVITSEDGLEIE